jgi:hypothetical protein
MTSDPQKLNVAIGYARSDWQVFPLAECSKIPKIPAAHPGGEPLQVTCNGACGRDGHGFYDATTDLEKIQQWWTQWPNANIGLRTGVAFDVLDIDGPTGLESLRMSAPYGGEDCFASVVGPTVQTGDGYHILMAVTGLGCATKFIPGCDFRGAGGYVVAAGSVHPNGKRYEWLDGYEPDDQPIDQAPGWLIELLPSKASSSPPSAVSPSKSTRYGLSALHNELGKLAVSAVGKRNTNLNDAAFSLGQLVASGHLDFEEVVNSLLIVARRIDLAEAEIIRTIRSGMMVGLMTPRTPKS